ncbi:MAG: carboxypeptidase Q, partial [Urechidicola sp.]
MKQLFLAVFTALLLISCNEKTTTVVIENETVNKTDSIAIKQFFNTALSDGAAYEWLRDLTQNIGGRLSGSPEAQMAVEWGEKLMKEEGFDKVWLQPVMVPHWVRGEKEVAN